MFSHGLILHIYHWLKLLKTPLGPFILSINLVGFQASNYSDTIYYSQDTKLAIGLGVALIAFGFLRAYWNKK